MIEDEKDKQQPEDCGASDSHCSGALVHRDDILMDLMEQIEEDLGELYPGFKVVCAGDMPDGALPPELVAQQAALQASFKKSLLNGLCIDCGAPMPNYEPDRDDWRPTEGWRWFTDMNDMPQCWQCPACDAKET